MNATRSKQRELVALANTLTYTPNEAADAACAAAVAVYRGDINARVFGQGCTPLLCVLACKCAPQTLAAIAGRGDVDMYRTDHLGAAPAFHALLNGTLPAWLRSFPDLDVNAPCHGRGLLAHAGLLCNMDAVLALLDAGAEFADMWGESGRPSKKPLLLWERDPQLAALVAPYAAWSTSCRRPWMVLCVRIARGGASVRAAEETGPLLPQVLADAVRMCIPPPPEEEQYKVISEYAGLVAAFL